jgi:hypothetical protein
MYFFKKNDVFKKNVVECNKYAYNSNNMFTFLQVLRWLTFFVTVYLPGSNGRKISGTKLTEPNSTTVPLYYGTGTKKYRTNTFYIYLTYLTETIKDKWSFKWLDRSMHVLKHQTQWLNMDPELPMPRLPTRIPASSSRLPVVRTV